jgi:hypothetical protein
MDNPFEGAIKIIKPPKQKKKKVIMREGIICTCGELDKINSSLWYLHKDNCFINLLKSKGG